MCFCMLHVFLRIQPGWSDAPNRSNPVGLVKTHAKILDVLCALFCCSKVLLGAVWDVFLKDCDEPEWLVGVDFFDAFDDPGWFFDFFCPGDECINVFGKTGATPAYSRVKERSADSAVKSHPCGDLVGVDTEFFAEVPDFVDETDFCCKEGVACVFDHLCCRQRCFYDRTGEVLVKFS